MPPKPIISKEDILRNAVTLVRQKGMENINARTLADTLNSSTKHLYSVFTKVRK